jgi:polyferredoxin
MILDLLPYKQNKAGRINAKWELLRYFHFGTSLALILILWFILEYRPTRNEELRLLIVGNIFYYFSAIILAYALKDNRAFCKYLCPITVIMKLTSRLSILKIKGDQNACTECGSCSKTCPMNIDIMAYVKNGERVLSTECIFCLTCTTVCPEKILDIAFGVDLGGKELLRREQKGTTI